MSGLPLVFIIGDSISMGYTPVVAKKLAGRARLARHEGNGGDTHNVLSRLSEWLAALGERPDVIHANAGLHDLRFWAEKGAYQVPPADYAQNMRLLAAKLKETGARVVWATTTPVIDGAPNMSREFPRENSDVEAYNAAALEAVREAGLAVDDLYSLVKERGPEGMMTPDGVHFTEPGCAALGARVARVIVDTLGG